MDPLTVILQPLAMQPFATWHPTRGAWETHQPDLFGQQAPYSETWPTCGMTHNGSAYRLHLPALLTIASVSSSSPTAGALFRTPLATDSSRGGETMETVRARGGTIALSHQIIDLVLNGPGGSTINSNAAETLFALVDSIFVAGSIRRRHRSMGAHQRTRRPCPRSSERGQRATSVAGVRGMAYGSASRMDHRSDG